MSYSSSRTGSEPLEKPWVIITGFFPVAETDAVAAKMMKLRPLLGVHSHLSSSSSSAVASGRRGIMSSTSDEEVPENQRYIHKSEVERFMMEAMEAVGTEKERAKMLAANLSEADYRGHFSHGLNRLAMYVNDCQTGICEPNANPKILRKGPATAWVDGQNGLGVVVGTYCMNLAIEMAKQMGIGWVSAKGSNHFGVCQWYTEMAIKEGLVGLASTNTSPLMIPTRSSTAIFGTNPFAVSAPGNRGDDRFTIDMSTSAVAIGKVEIQLRKGELLPSKGWAIGKDGHPTTDANEAFYHGKGKTGIPCASGGDAEVLGTR